MTLEKTAVPDGEHPIVARMRLPAGKDLVPLKIRSGVMFGIACVTSPCCTPLYVPLVLALLAGTPVAIWLSAHVGWVYGGLTLISILSFVIGFRSLRQKSTAKQSTKTNRKSEPLSVTEMSYSQE